MQHFLEKRRWAFIPETLYPPRMGLKGLCPYHCKNTNGAFMSAWNNSWKAVENGKTRSGIVCEMNVERKLDGFENYSRSEGLNY